MWACELDSTKEAQNLRTTGERNFASETDEYSGTHISTGFNNLMIFFVHNHVIMNNM